MRAAPDPTTVRTPRTRRTALGLAGLVAVSGSLLGAAPAAADPGAEPPGCESRVNASLNQLLTCVTLEGVREHQTALQGIADANGGNRASGTPGYTASADYVEATLRASGYRVARESFDFPFFSLESSSFAQVTPTPTTYAVDTDYVPMTYTGSGTVDDGAVVAVDPARTGAGSGCEAEDFTATPVRGSVALVQRGGCAFAVKAANAGAAGAVAVIVVNNVEGPLNGTLGAPGTGIPVIGVPTVLGAQLAGSVVDLSVTAISEVRTTENLTADLPGKRTDGVVVVGAHLDSVLQGPGMNDNGTGSAAILELAQDLSRSRLDNPVRFAFWGAEELGLLGSQRYVDTRSSDQLAAIGSYLNFDMVGSPNAVRFVYDSDGSTFEAPEGYVTPESALIEATFEEFYDSRGLAYEDTEFDGRSDYEAFADAGIPSGGLFTGAEGIKTEAQAAAFGGTAGEAYDPCYHQACDDLDNVDPTVLDQNADAIAYAVYSLARSGAQGHGHGKHPDDPRAGTAGQPDDQAV